MIDCSPVTHCFIVSPSSLFKRQKARIFFLNQGIERHHVDTKKANSYDNSLIDVFYVSEHLTAILSTDVTRI